MNVVGNRYEVRNDQGFDVYVLNNQEVELAVVPELGARIISLKDLRTGREWLWHPDGGRKLFRNHAGDAFEQSPLVGMDECCPTVAPCSWQGRQLPDHGELWAVPWTVNGDVWETGVLRTFVRLKISPFDFERSIELQGNEIRLSYRLHDRGDSEESFLWAMHPLLRLQSGDQLQLPASSRALVKNATWIDAVDSALPAAACEKVFARPVSDGIAAINNPKSGDRLTLEWDASENNTLGLWLSRGGWHGHHHFAIEPANGEPDALTTAAKHKRCGIIGAHGSANWQVSLRVGT
jgi:galactose mutarotase-like enzyme